jgi:glyoxylate reductase
MKPKVYVTRMLPKPAMDKINSYCDAKTWEGELPPPKNMILENVKDADGLLCLVTDKIDAELMDSGPKLKVIAQYAVGFDNIDLDAATKRGIIVTNTPVVSNDAVADFTFALILAAGRRVLDGDKHVRAGLWKTWGPLILVGQDVYQKTLGIIGLGRIGAAVAKRATGFGMKLMYYDIIRQPKWEQELGIEFVSLERVLTESDFITIHTNLTKETYHLLGAEQFKKMKPTCVVVNTGRGPIIDTMALAEALRNKRIAYAALDVTETEPIAPDHPLLELDNVIITPHIASASIQARTAMGMLAADNLIAGLKGEMPPTPVNPDALKNRK